ncbi:MAG: hypothetical protein JOZ97_09170 [Candidatus Eremiobacteraeota bacterium]|nr:hypothetical protein [Candidatus Eremiobacteraeota bacterium]
MHIARVVILLSLAAVSPAPTAQAASSDPLAQWFQTGRCAAFNNVSSPKVPFARNDGESIQWMHRVPPFQPSGAPTYIYDAKRGTVFRTLGQDSTGSFIARTIGPPPAKARRGDLSNVATTSGIRLGTTGATVVQKLGKPYVVRGCGLERYAYLINRQVGGNALEFTLKNGRVVEIYQTYGD